MMIIHYLLKIINYVLRIVLPAKLYARYCGMKLGHNCIISTKLIGSEAFLITLGNHVHITTNVQFINHDGAVHLFRNEYPDFDIFGKIEVGDNTYIGNNAIILPGVIIGKNCIIGANSVVTKCIPDNSVVAGNPAKYICKTDDYLQKILNKNAETKGSYGSIRKNKIINLPDDKLIKKSWLYDIKD